MSNLILRDWNGKSIRHREDGFLSATDMCQAGGKLFGHWHSLKTTKEYLEALKLKYYLDLSANPVESNVGGLPETTGTWVDRRVAIRLAQWISPTFALQVDEWVIAHLEETNNAHTFKLSFFNSLLEAGPCEKAGFVYALHDEGNFKVKIGYTANPMQRLKQLQHGDSGSSTFYGVRMTATVGEARIHEKYLHELFDFDRLSGEWFRDSLMIDCRFLDYFSGNGEFIFPWPLDSITTIDAKKNNAIIDYCDGADQ